MLAVVLFYPNKYLFYEASHKIFEYDLFKICNGNALSPYLNVSMLTAVKVLFMIFYVKGSCNIRKRCNNSKIFHNILL